MVCCGLNAIQDTRLFVNVGREMKVVVVVVVVVVVIAVMVVVMAAAGAVCSQCASVRVYTNVAGKTSTTANVKLLHDCVCR